MIREATLHDIPAIQEVRNSVTENMLSNPGLVPDSDVLDYITRRGKGWVSLDMDHITGFAIGDRQDNNVWALFIRPGADKKGTGRKLQDILLRWYFYHTKELIWLSTSPGTRAEAFYRRSGWREAGTHGKNEIRFEMTYDEYLLREAKDF